MKTILYLLLIFSAQICFGKSGLNDTTYMNKSKHRFSNGTKDNYRYFSVRHIDSVTMAPQKVIKEEIYCKSGQLLGNEYLLMDKTRKNTGLSSYYDTKGRLKKCYLFNYKDNLKYFSKTLDYMKCVNACDIAGSDLSISFYPDGHIAAIGFYSPSNGHFSVGKTNRICEWKIYGHRKHRGYTYEYADGK